VPSRYITKAPRVKPDPTFEARSAFENAEKIYAGSEFVSAADAITIPHQKTGAAPPCLGRGGIPR